jgi:hypothetical protein
MQCTGMCQHNIEECTRNYCWRRKAISDTCSEYVSLASGIQHAKGISRIIFSSVACPTLPCFSTQSQNENDFRGKKKKLTVFIMFGFRGKKLLYLKVLIFGKKKYCI